MITKKPHIFLDPLGRQDLGLLFIVEGKTGVWYQNQCGGKLCEIKTTEGYLIPLGQKEIEQEIYCFFRTTFKKQDTLHWNANTLKQLNTLLNSIFILHTKKNGEEEQLTIQLDTLRINECLEAWIPVKTKIHKGILTLINHD